MRSKAVSFYKKPWISVPNKNCDNLWTKTLWISVPFNNFFLFLLLFLLPK